MNKDVSHILRNTTPVVNQKFDQRSQKSNYMSQGLISKFDM